MRKRGSEKEKRVEDEGDLVEILRKIFTDNPGKSTIEIKKNCSDCGREIIVKITSTAGGYGLQGGVFIQCSPDAYVAACPDCYNANSKMDSDNHV